MIKYIDKAITFAEIPDEVCLTYNISNCDGLCEGCHSPELRGDSGSALVEVLLEDLRSYGNSITCVCFLGEGAKNPNYEEEWTDIFTTIRQFFPNLKIGMYSGKTEINWLLCDYLDYYKVGPYIAALGPLNSRTTNQRLYAIQRPTKEKIDITYKFWGNDNEN